MVPSHAVPWHLNDHLLLLEHQTARVSPVRFASAPKGSLRVGQSTAETFNFSLRPGIKLLTHMLFYWPDIIWSHFSI